MSLNPTKALSSLEKLPLPLQSIGIDCVVGPEGLAEAAHAALQIKMTWGIQGDRTRRTEFSILNLGDLAITSGRTSAVRCTSSESDHFTITLCHFGAANYRHDTATLTVEQGEILTFPNQGGQVDCIQDSGICFQVERHRLAATMLTLSNGSTGLRLNQPFCLPGASGLHNNSPRGGLFTLFRFIDRLILEDPYLANGLGLDEQIYRMLAFSFFQQQGDLERIRLRYSGQRRWSSRLDELIDRIKANPAQALTMTDLERISHYSARHLQKLFRERFQCSPMQYIRQQRLALAMSLLSATAGNTSVTRVARDCGYHFRSNFSVDFKREFGLSPSVVLRQSRAERP